MGWKIWAADWATTASMEDASLYQPAKMNKDLILRAVRVWILVHGDPDFESLNMKIYSNEVVNGLNTPRKLLHTSTDVRTKAEIHTEPYAVKEIYFTFDDVPLRGVDTYNFVINAVGYDPDVDSYLGWRRGFPDPVYAQGFRAALDIIERAPFCIYFIGAEA